jgi:hypothetical protein
MNIIPTEDFKIILKYMNLGTEIPKLSSESIAWLQKNFADENLTYLAYSIFDTLSVMTQIKDFK